MANEQDDFGGFDPEKEKQQSDAIPKGEYRFVVENFAQKKSKNGLYLQNVATFQVLQGEFINRKIFERFNFQFLGTSQSDTQKKAVNIGRAQFAKLCKAIGLLSPKKCAEVIGKTFIGAVDVSPGDDDYGPQNKIKKYSPSSGKVAETASAPAGTAGDWKS